MSSALLVQQLIPQLAFLAPESTADLAHHSGADSRLHLRESAEEPTRHAVHQYLDA